MTPPSSTARAQVATMTLVAWAACVLAGGACRSPDDRADPEPVVLPVVVPPHPPAAHVPPAPPRVVSSSPVLAFVDATVVPMETTVALPHQTLLVQNGQIVALGRVADVVVPPGATRVDAAGKFVMPGLHDMHVHLDGTRGMLTSFVAAGVTTVRNMAGSSRVLALRQRIDRGELLGPTIFTAGPFVDGVRPRWEGSETVKTPADAERVVAAQAAAGYDYVKIYNGLTPLAYDAIAASARAHGMRMVGHVPFHVPLAHVLEAGQASIEHFTGYAVAIERPDSPVRERATTTSVIRRWQYADPARITEVAEATARHGVWNCPTLVTSVVYGELWRGRVPAADLETVSPDWLARWDPTHSPKKLQKAVRRAMEQAHDKILEVQLSLVRELTVAGAPLLAGTDTPNPYVVPGASLHQELALFVEAGLSPYAALRAATIDAAEFLGDPHDGRIAVGAKADLVMLDADPLVDIHALDRISGVVVRGTWLPADRLRTMHDELVAEYHEPIWERAIMLGEHAKQYVVRDNGAPIGAYAFARYGATLEEKQTLEDETVSTVSTGTHGLSLDIDRPEGRVQIDHKSPDHLVIGWLTPATAQTLVTAHPLAVQKRVALSVVQPDPDDPASLLSGDLAVTRASEREYRLRITIEHGTWVGKLVVDGDGTPRMLRVSSTTRPIVRTWQRR